MPSAADITRHHDADPTEDPWVHGPPAPERIELSPYDPCWPDRFTEIIAAVLFLATLLFGAFRGGKKRGAKV